MTTFLDAIGPDGYYPKLRKRLDKIAEDSVKKNLYLFEALNAGQMLQGENANGTKIGRYHNRKYASRKAAMNPLPGSGNVDLKLTGAFYKGITANLAGDDITIDSTDPKSLDLTEKYGKNGSIWGLNADSDEVMLQAVYHDAAEKVEEVTGLEFKPKVEREKLPPSLDGVTKFL